MLAAAACGHAAMTTSHSRTLALLKDRSLMLHEQYKRFHHLRESLGGANDTCFEHLLDWVVGPVKVSSPRDLENLTSLLDAHRGAVEGQRDMLNAIQLADSFQPLLVMAEEMKSEARQDSLKLWELQGTQEARPLVAGFPHLSSFVLEHALTIVVLFAGGSLLSYFLVTELGDARRKSTVAHTTLLEAVASRLDAHFAASKLAKPLLLLAVTFLLIVLSAFGCMLMGADLGEGLWQSWLFAADPGTHADVESGGLRAVAFGTTLGGMCIFALMVGIISDLLSDQMEDLKQVHAHAHIHTCIHTCMHTYTQ